MPVYVFNVEMTCPACPPAVDQALKELGVEDFDISLETQKVVVTTDLPQSTVFEAIEKTGKAVTIAN